MHQTMVDSFHCLDRVVPEGMSQVSRRSEVGNHKRRHLTPGYLLALLNTLHPARETYQVVATSGKKTCFDAGRIGFCHCAAVLQTQVPKLCTDLDLGLLYILIFETYSKFARKNDFLALGVCFSQLCSTGRRFAASRSRLQNYRRIVSFPQQKFR